MSNLQNDRYIESFMDWYDNLPLKAQLQLALDADLHRGIKAPLDQGGVGFDLREKYDDVHELNKQYFAGDEILELMFG